MLANESVALWPFFYRLPQIEKLFLFLVSTIQRFFLSPNLVLNFAILSDGLFFFISSTIVPNSRDRD